jgi:signal transduction histidine kinase
MMQYTSEVAKNLMMDLLDLAQIENNSFKITNERFSLFSAIKQAFNVVAHVATRRSV